MFFHRPKKFSFQANFLFPNTSALLVHSQLALEQRICQGLHFCVDTVQIEENELKLVSGHDGRRLASVSESVPTWTLDLKSGFTHPLSPSLLVCVTKIQLNHREMISLHSLHVVSWLNLLKRGKAVKYFCILLEGSWQKGNN